MKVHTPGAQLVTAAKAAISDVALSRGAIEEFDLAQSAAAQAKVRLDGDAWLAAGFSLLAIEGIDGVRVELLARKLGVTKGSFYWHFKDRDAFHGALLERWRRNATSDLIQWFEQKSEPRDLFGQLLRMPCISRLPDQTLDVELALRLWARRDERPAAVLQEVDELRIRHIGSLIASCGVPAEEVRARAVLAYGYNRMSGSLADEAITDLCERLLTLN
jgi:AcrR family transcriptional regulator